MRALDPMCEAAQWAENMRTALLLKRYIGQHGCCQSGSETTPVISAMESREHDMRHYNSQVATKCQFLAAYNPSGKIQ